MLEEVSVEPLILEYWVALSTRLLDLVNQQTLALNKYLMRDFFGSPVATELDSADSASTHCKRAAVLCPLLKREQLGMAVVVRLEYLSCCCLIDKCLKLASAATAVVELVVRFVRSWAVARLRNYWSSLRDWYHVGED